MVKTHKVLWKLLLPSVSPHLPRAKDVQGLFPADENSVWFFKPLLNLGLGILKLLKTGFFGFVASATRALKRLRA